MVSMLAAGAFMGCMTSFASPAFVGIILFLGIGGIGVCIGLGLWIVGAIKYTQEVWRS